MTATAWSLTFAIFVVVYGPMALPPRSNTRVVVTPVGSASIW